MISARPGFWCCAICATHVPNTSERCPVCETHYLSSSRTRSAIRAVVYEILEEIKARERAAATKLGPPVGR